MAWSKTSKNGYDIFSESALVLDDNESASAEIVTVTSALPDGLDWENTKFPLTVDINVGSATTTIYSKEVDASSVYAPYARFALKTAATDLTDAAGRCSIIFAHKPSKPNNEGLAAGDFGGVGKDPS